MSKNHKIHCLTVLPFLWLHLPSPGCLSTGGASSSSRPHIQSKHKQSLILWEMLSLLQVKATYSLPSLQQKRNNGAERSGRC